MDYSMVGKRIREYRLGKNMTQLMLAEKKGLSEMSVHLYETGQHLPALEPLLKLSEALGVSPDSLLCDYITATDEPAGNDVLDRLDRLPDSDKERILKIIGAMLEGRNK